MKDVANEAINNFHKTLKPLDKPWEFVTDKDIITAMNSGITDFLMMQ